MMYRVSAKIHYTNKLTNLLCNITNELVGLWALGSDKTSVQLVGRCSSHLCSFECILFLTRN
jgi:hypothetical protein